MGKSRKWKIAVAVERTVVARDKDNADRLAQEFAYSVDEALSHLGFHDAETAPLHSQPLPAPAQTPFAENQGMTKRARIYQDEYDFYHWESDDGLAGGPFQELATAQSDAKWCGYEPYEPDEEDVATAAPTPFAENK